MVTLYHWDTPQAFNNSGGWQNSTISDHFANYSRLCYERFGDRVIILRNLPCVGDSDPVIILSYQTAAITPLYFIRQVKLWITLNEPWVVSNLGYELGVNAPGLKGRGDRIYQVAHNLIKSHAKAYRVYEKEFKQKQKGNRALFGYKTLKYVII